MHRFDEIAARTMVGVLANALDRLRLDPAPLDGVATPEELARLAPSMIRPEGTDPEEVLRVFAEVLAPAVISADSPRYFAFIPTAPTKASLLFDLVISAASLNGISWLDASGAVWAENQALRFLAELAGYPSSAGGCFVAGGSAANLSALAVARDTHRRRHPQVGGQRAILVGQHTHSSVATTARLLDLELIVVPPDPDAATPSDRERFTAAGARAALVGTEDPERICAVVGTGGATNTGVIDDLPGLADVAADHGMWFHVDAAYGGGALLSPRHRSLLAGIERSDSFIVDPHKWLFAPFDCGALLYRDPTTAPPTHTQAAEYLDVLHPEWEAPPSMDGVWNPTDYAYHLTRRARGLPLWFSLSVYGTDAYADAVDRGFAVAEYARSAIAAHPRLELCLESDLTVVVFRRPGWSLTDYQAWSDELLASQVGFVVPSAWAGEPVLRMVFLHPDTTPAIVDEVLATL